MQFTICCRGLSVFEKVETLFRMESPDHLVHIPEKWLLKRENIHKADLPTYDTPLRICKNMMKLFYIQKRKEVDIISSCHLPTHGSSSHSENQYFSILWNVSEIDTVIERLLIAKERDPFLMLIELVCICYIRATVFSNPRIQYSSPMRQR